MGAALELFVNRFRDSIGRKVDLGLVGENGVVHPSLEVSTACRCCSISGHTQKTVWDVYTHISTYRSLKSCRNLKWQFSVSNFFVSLYVGALEWARLLTPHVQAV